MKKVLFIDRDGTIIKEPADYQIDSFEKLEFLPEVFTYLSKIALELDYELVMVTNQDGLGTTSFPEETFYPVHNFMIKALENENINFKDIFIDKSFEHENLSTRKPGTGMLSKYIYGNYDLANSFVIGDRLTDVQLAENLAAKSIYITTEENEVATFSTNSWKEIYNYLKGIERTAKVVRKSKETEITVEVNLDNASKTFIDTGLKFLDHMLMQISAHGNIGLYIQVKGDLEVDEHHTIEDTAMVLGDAILKALGSKKGIERYGFLLPMDDCLAQVAIDFGGRAQLVWNVTFTVDRLGDVPTEMFSHFFKSFCDYAKCNLNIKSEGENNHHKIEAVFKAFAKAMKIAVSQNNNYNLPSTKGIL